jgi:hypothetical protein
MEAKAYGYIKGEPEYNAWVKDQYKQLTDVLIDNPETQSLKEKHAAYNDDISLLI